MNPTGVIDLHVDTLARLLIAGGEFRSTHEGLAVDPARAFAGGVRALCTACFTGEYPVPIVTPPSRRQLRLVEV